MSSAVKGVPSCHFTLGWSFQVVSMVPSGLTRQVPRSTAMFSSASMGWKPPVSFATTR